MVHPLVEPAHLIVLLALMLGLGRRGQARSGPAVRGFIAGLVAGLIAAGIGWRPDTDIILLAVAGLIGITVAASLPVPAWVFGAGCLVAGAGIGFGSGPEAASRGALVATLAGTGLGAAVWLFNGAELVQRARRRWFAVLVRVAGSWVSAGAVLVLALWFAGPRAPNSASSAVPVLDTGR